MQQHIPRPERRCSSGLRPLMEKIWWRSRSMLSSESTSMRCGVPSCSIVIGIIIISVMAATRCRRSNKKGKQAGPSHTQSVKAQAKATHKPSQGTMWPPPMYVYVVRDVRDWPCLVKAHRPATSTITAGFMAGPAPLTPFTSHHQLPSAYSYTLYINTTLPFGFLKASPAAHARRPCGGTRTHKKQVPTRA